MTDSARVKEVFLEALERPTGERATFLDQACGGDGALRASVERLIEAHERAGAAFEPPSAIRAYRMRTGEHGD